MPYLSQALEYITVYVLTNEYNAGWKKMLREWGKKMSKATRMPPEGARSEGLCTIEPKLGSVSEL